jgi:peptidoglycan L-alanyl-D-glutamate endopeptidase CwlK
MDGIDPRLVEICYRALEISPIDFGIPQYGGKRTAEEQKELQLDGKSKCDGFYKKSYHQTGKALDFYAYVDGKASWDEFHLTQVAAAFLQAASEQKVKLQWGGHWTSFKDMPHVQLVK